MSKKNFNPKQGKRGGNKFGKKAEGANKFPAVSIDPSYKERPTQDAEWYKKLLELAKDVGTIVYSQSNGYAISGYNSAGNGVYSTPGVMVLDVVPCPGVSVGEGSPFNVAVSKNYTAIRKLNANNIPYDPADLGMYLYGVMDVHMMISRLFLLYGAVNHFDVTNAYWPRAIVTALGADYNDLRKNRAGLRELINNCIAAINSRALPKDFTIIQRYIWMMGHVFGDSGNTKGQVYAYRPAGYYVYTPYEDKRGGSLKWKDIDRDDLLTLESLTTIMDEMINALLLDNDIRMISGDIAKTFDESALMTWTPITPDYSMVMLYNPEILSQIENAVIAPTGFFTGCIGNGSMDITQSDGYVYYMPDTNKANLNTQVPVSQCINNQHSSVPSVDDVLVSTRLSTLYEETSETLRLQAAGSEWISAATITYLDKDSNMRSVPYTTAVNLTHPDDDDFDIEMSRLLGTNFDWAPIRVIHNQSTFYGFMGDLDNWMIFDSALLSRIHNVCLRSEFTNESAGFFK